MPGNNSVISLINKNKVNDALRVINSNTFDENEVDKNNRTPLMIACQKRLKPIVSALIKSGRDKIDAIDKDGNTALIYALKSGLDVIVKELILTGKSNVENVTNNGKTALTVALEQNSSNMILELIIDTGKSKPGHITPDGETPLIMACNNDDTTPNIVLKLIETGESNTGFVSMESGETALMVLIMRFYHNPDEINEWDEVIKKLIELKEGVGAQSSDGLTALALCCSNEEFQKYNFKKVNMIYNNFNEYAIKLLETGQSRPETVFYINGERTTALSAALLKQNKELVTRLLDSGKSNPFVNYSMLIYTASLLAKNPEFKDIYERIQNLPKTDIEINVNSNGTNMITHETMVIKTYLNENKDHVCFKYGNSYFLSSKNLIKQQFKDTNNIKYSCLNAGDTTVHLTSTNINDKISYFSLSSIIGIQSLIKDVEVNKIINGSTQLYVLLPSGMFNGLMSQAFYDGAVDGIGADHCQTGKPTELCVPVEGIAVEGTKSKSVSKSKKSLSKTPEIVHIQYKTDTLTIDVHENMTIGDLKMALLNKLVEMEKIDGSANKTVKLIYLGKLYGVNENNKLLTSLPNFEYGITLSSVIQKMNGGRRTRKKR